MLIFSYPSVLTYVLDAQKNVRPDPDPNCLQNFKIMSRQQSSRERVNQRADKPYHLHMCFVSWLNSITATTF